MAAQPPDILIQQQPIAAGKKYIKVNKPGIEKSAGSAIVFKNNLPGNPEAQVTFYDMTSKGSMPITDFCSGQTQTYFPVPGTGNGEAACTLTKASGNYAYSISASGYETLDPIIIIEPQFTTPPKDPKVITSGIVGALLGAAIMFVLMRTVFAKSSEGS